MKQILLLAVFISISIRVLACYACGTLIHFEIKNTIMKKFFYLFLLAGFVGFVACDKDDHEHDDEMDTPEYHAHINSPNEDDKHVGDTIHIHVDFEEHDGMTVHHVNVKIYNEKDPTIIAFDGPTDAHVHEESGKYELHADLVLDGGANVMEHTDWILEAKVWGHEDGAAEVTEMIKFHVHPR